MTVSDRPSARRSNMSAGAIIALAYLVVCAALLIWAFAVTAADDTGESMAAVIPLLAAAPVSLVALMLPGDGPATVVVAIALGASANAAAIWWCARALHRSDGAGPVS
ncbi:SCO4225 family membrane protein [Streptomyces sp. NPDC051041]|uniref:SCO4225 family membrane protein n=1 Tax=Streptomyces sp. NPDC051041 TaxID=3365640 RepID=UPI0037922223